MKEYSEAKTYKSKPELRNSNVNADYFYSSAEIIITLEFVYNRPFYSCLLSDLAFVWQQG